MRLGRTGGVELVGGTVQIIGRLVTLRQKYHFESAGDESRRLTVLSEQPIGAALRPPTLFFLLNPWTRRFASTRAFIDP